MFLHIVDNKMKLEDRIKMFKDVFSPKSGEKVLFIVDVPHDNIKDSKVWLKRRELANEWYNTFKRMGVKMDFSVDFIEYPATGIHNSPVPLNIIEMVKKSNLVIAMTEYSATSSLAPICLNKENITRCASLPGVEKKMEKTAFKADYTLVSYYASVIENLLNKSIKALVKFSTGDKILIDLRNRIAMSDKGDCSKTGQFINFPSGEACKAPYEASIDEIKKYGKSETEGVLPVRLGKNLVKYIVKNNKIIEVIGGGRKAEEMRKFFSDNDSRRNIAELGIGCNPKAVITGNILEDEKVGLHIAYGMSSHIGGKVNSDMHQDICYSKGCPVEGTTLELIHLDGSKTELIRDAELRYDLLK
jgi:hypothetical protein